MNFDEDNPHPLSGKVPVVWPGKKPPGRAEISCPPQVPEILAALAQNFCTCNRGDNCHEIINKKGDVIELPYSATVQDWIDAVRQLGSHEANEPIGTDIHASADD